jgi:hypothetical protein
MHSQSDWLNGMSLLITSKIIIIINQGITTTIKPQFSSSLLKDHPWFPVPVILEVIINLCSLSALCQHDKFICVCNLEL